MRARSGFQKLAAASIGTAAALVLLEFGLRAGGAAFQEQQDRRNRESLADRPDRVVLCVGESTTAMGGEDSFPGQLQQVLDERVDGVRIAVVNAGVPGADTSVLVSQLPTRIEQYRPDVVVAMMGANDIPGGAIPTASVPVAEPTGTVHALRTVQLARQVWHEIVGQEREGPGHERTYGDLVGEGERLARSFRLAEAEPVLLRALEIDPEGTEACMGLGTLYETLGRTEEAEQMLLRAADLCPTCEPPRIELARHHERLEHNEQAVEHFHAAIDTHPRSVKAWFGLGRILRKQERFVEAAGAFEQVLELESTHAQAHVSLGLCLEAQGQIEPAAEALRRGWRLAGDRRSFIRLADFYERQGLGEPMRLLVSEGMEGNPDDDVLGRIARYHHRRGDRAEGDRYQQMADEARTQAVPEMTRANYRTLRSLLDERAIPLIAAQYPVRSAAPLEALFPPDGDVVVVDNSTVFREALQTRPYADLFWDSCYGDFGHCTAQGNRLLAENVAGALIGVLAL